MTKPKNLEVMIEGRHIGDFKPEHDCETGPVAEGKILIWEHFTETPSDRKILLRCHFNPGKARTNAELKCFGSVSSQLVVQEIPSFNQYAI